MKSFNKHHILAPLSIILLLSGCVPDSLTKFSKDSPSKSSSSATVTPPIVDSTGTAITFDEPTFFYYFNKNDSSFGANIGTTLSASPVVDGSLGDSTKKTVFFDRCDLVVSGVNAISATLPAGIALTTSTCSITGVPLAIKTVTTAFCSDLASPDQATCESTPLTWNAATSKCSNPDYQYISQSACTTSYNKWYPVGSSVPFRIKMSYRNATREPKAIYTTLNIGIYKKLTKLSYSQAEKIRLKVTGTGSLSAISPLLTTSTTSAAYARTNMIFTQDGEASVAKIVDTSLNEIGINRLIPIKVASITPFTINTFITKSGDSSKIARIFKIDSSLKTLYVENISANNKYFIKAESICANNITGSCATSYPIIDIIDQTNGFYATTSVDNDNQYYTNNFTITTPTNVYEVGHAIKPLMPIATSEINAENGIKYTISPALPCFDPNDSTQCVSLDPDTGIISGTFAASLASTKFTIQATNLTGSVFADIYLSSIVGPSDLALANKQIITVSNTAFFKEGETLFAPIVPPLTNSTSGIIIKIIDPYKIAVRIITGAFTQNTQLDSGNLFLSEKAFVIPDNSCTDTNYATKETCEAATQGWSIGPVYYNTAIKQSATGGFVAGDYINSTAGIGAGAKGVVSYVQTGVSDTLYVNYISQAANSVAQSKTFYQGDTLDNSATILNVSNDALKIGVASAASFNLGVDVTTDKHAGAYTHKVVGNYLYLNDISLSDLSLFPTAKEFSINDLVYNDEAISSATASTTINSVTHDNFFLTERGLKFTIPAVVSAGNNLVFSISPALPAGLTLDTQTGFISGTATYSSPRKDYILTAQNFIGSSSFVFALEARDYFQIKDKTQTPSFLLHKVGDTQATRKCRINASDIQSASPQTKALDIRCLLDAEEEDLYFSGLKLQATTGPSVCEYIEYAPYYINTFSPAQSKGVTSKYQSRVNVYTGCLTSGTIPEAKNVCESYYTTESNPSAPNCDEGYVEYNAITMSFDNSATPACTIASAPVVTKVYCGGKKTNCINGPIRDLLTDGQIDKGSRAMVYAASAGITQNWEHSSPISHLDLTNIRLANATIKNQCSSSNAHFNTWESAVFSLPSTASPFAKSNPYYSFYCLNSAKEIKARIRINVRDWDENFKISDGIDNSGPSSPAAKMNNAGLDIFSNPYNNFADWDDHYASGAAAKYLGGNCSTKSGGTCGGAWPTSSADCLAVGGTWAGAYCEFNNQNQCELQEGVWTPNTATEEDYKFPGSAI